MKLNTRISAINLVVVMAMSLLSACSNVTESKTNSGTTVESSYKSIEGQRPVVAYDDYQDPLEVINRPIFTFNNVAYTWFLSPLAKGYKAITPSLLRTGIANFFDNLREPLWTINHLAQARFGDSVASITRFGLNSTLGILGLYDFSGDVLGVEKSDTSFSETLAVWGIGYGMYIVLPILGPSDLRSASALYVDRLAHPFHYIDHKETRWSLTVVDDFQGRATILQQYPNLIKELDDPYIFTRNLYLQQTQRDIDFRKQQRSPRAGDKDE